jgi:hypothetical protein
MGSFVESRSDNSPKHCEPPILNSATRTILNLPVAAPRRKLEDPAVEGVPEHLVEVAERELPVPPGSKATLQVVGYRLHVTGNSEQNNTAIFSLNPQASGPKLHFSPASAERRS